MHGTSNVRTFKSFNVRTFFAGILPIYKSPWGRKKILSYYEAALRDWPGDFESMAIDTRYGPTHTIAAGPTTAPSLLLLHGLGDTALLWRPLFSALSQHFRVYAPDIVGQPGKSASIRLAYKSHQYAEWLQDILDELMLSSTHIAGLSLGSFLALQLSAFAPERVGRVALLSPAGIVPVRWLSLLAMLPVGLLPTRAKCRRFMERTGATVTDEAVEWAYLISRHFIPAPPPPVFSAHELRRVTAPVSILVGQYDLFFDADAIVRRARQHLSNLAAAQIIPKAGHNLVREKTSIVQAFMLSAFER